MALAATAPLEAAVGPRISVESLRLCLLWLTGFSGAFVFIEPSPYEFVASVAVLLFAVTGMSLRVAIAPLIALLLLMLLGYGIAVVPVSDYSKSVTWVFISIFMALTAVFYAAMLGTNTQSRLEALLRGYIAAAVIASVAAIGGYFRLFGGASEMLVLYDRARGTFNDPNVLGAFLVLPGLLLVQRILAGRRTIRSGILLLVMLAALFLTFSRGAWAQFALSAMLLMFITFLTSTSVREKLRIVVVAVAGICAIAVLVAALLSFGQVSNLFSERAALEQSYDVGRYGRFGRYFLGADIALEHPLGIGPLQFYLLFVEDPHNTFLNTFLSGGWLAGFGYLTLSVVTIAMSSRFLLARTPWRPLYQAVYAAYLGVIGESVIIDIDHWRHYFLILGVLWGLMAASARYVAQDGSAVAQRTGQV